MCSLSKSHIKMANHMILLLALFITFFHTTNSSKIAPPAFSNLNPVPPQPSQVCNLIYWSNQILKIIFYH